MVGSVATSFGSLSISYSRVASFSFWRKSFVPVYSPPEQSWNDMEYSLRAGQLCLILYAYISRSYNVIECCVVCRSCFWVGLCQEWIAQISVCKQLGRNASSIQPTMSYIMHEYSLQRPSHADSTFAGAHAGVENVRSTYPSIQYRNKPSLLVLIRQILLMLGYQLIPDHLVST